MDENFTEAQATDEAVLMFSRRLHRLHPEAFASIMVSLPDEIRSSLALAERRADVRRSSDLRAGITRTYADAATVTLADLTKRLGLADHEQSAVCAWTGYPYGTTWTEDEAEVLRISWWSDLEEHHC